MASTARGGGDGDRALGVAVVGTGLAGLASALALAARGVPTTLIGPRRTAEAAARDTRSTALFGPSLDFLAHVGALARLEAPPVPLVGLRLIDATDAIIRAPEVLFEARELGLAEFGVNIENASLLGALTACVDASPGIRWLGVAAASCSIDEGRAAVRLEDGTVIEVALLVGADGEHSLCRTTAGIATRSWQYPQVAIASRFEHRRPHLGVSTELHRRAGPLTTVPLPGNWSSLVWVDEPAEATRLMARAEPDFAAELETRLGSVLGAVTAVGPRASFPLSGVTASRIGANRVALVGEAAHRLPPIGAQGLNLGLRDAAWLADLVAEARASGRDPGAPDVLDAYERSRRGDVASRTAIVDALNRSLIAGLLPIDMIRGAGLAALKTVGPLRRFFMREGMGPAGALPHLMQPLSRHAS